MAPDGNPRRFDVLFTHYHWDHLQGLPFFGPLYDPGAHFTFHGFPVRERGVRELLETAIGPPWFPVALSDTPSTKHYLDLTSAPLEVGPFLVHSARLSHPQGVTAYRIEHGDGAMVVATDVECGNDEDDAALVALSRDVDVLVHDAQYTPDELPTLRGRGHSSWRQAVDTARRSGARRLILFHHDPRRTDADIDALVREAARELPAVEGAREGSEFEF